MPIQSMGERIRKARQALGLSGVALAKLIDKSQPYVSDLERGQRTPSVETLLSLSSALGQPISYFFGEQASPPPAPKGNVSVAASAAEVRNVLAELVADQVTALPAFQGEDAPDREKMVRIVEQAIDNAYHQLHRALRQQRQQEPTQVS